MASTYLSRTSGTATSTQKFTVSAWVKQCLNPSGATDQAIWGVGSSNTNLTYLRLRSADNSLQLYIEAGGSEISNYVTNRLFRDTSAWYHIVLAVDTTQSTAANRVKIYVNGVQETSFSSSVVPSVNHSVAYLSSNLVNIGRRPHANNNYFDGSMANVEFVDGQQLTPAYFGSTDSTTGIWTPQASSTISSYGTNGFKLKMDTATPGADTSGNTNTFTVGGGTPTLTQGSPSNVYATLNPLARFQVAPTYSNGNNTITAGAGGSGSSPFSTIGASSGKYYAELSLGSVNGGGISCGIIDITQFNPNFQTDAWFYYPTYGYAYMSSNGKKGNNNAEANYANSYTNGDRIGVAMDLDNNKLYFAKNGVWQNSGDPTSGATGTGAAFTIADGTYGFAVYGYDSKVWNANFGEGFFGTTAAGTQADDNGQGLFAYDVPAGYYALNTKNLEAYG